MKLELVDPACLALVGCWVLLVQLLSALRVPEMIRRLLMTPDAQAEQIRLRARDLQEQIAELQRLCEQINSVDTFVEYAKARRQINKFQAELGRLPKPAAPEGGVDSPAINKLLAIGFEVNFSGPTPLLPRPCHRDHDRRHPRHAYFVDKRVCVNSLGLFAGYSLCGAQVTLLFMIVGALWSRGPLLLVSGLTSR